MTDSKLEELIELKNKLSKETDNDILLNLLNKFELNIESYSLDNFVNSKIGKTLKIINNKEDKTLKNKSLELINKMKNLLKKTKEKSCSNSTLNNADDINKKINMSSPEKSRNNPINNEFKTNNASDKKNTLKEFNKESYNECYKKIQKELIINDNSQRTKVRNLLFDALVSKEECNNDKLLYIKNITICVENCIFDKLYSHLDKGSKYIQRSQSIFFNLKVISILIILIKFVLNNL